jgi:hypothetical protein
MKTNLSPEERKTAAREAVIANLEKAVLGTETCIKSIRYLEKVDAVRIEYDTDLTLFVSGTKKNNTALFYEVIGKLHKWSEKDLQTLFLRSTGTVTGSWLDCIIQAAK